MRPVLLLAFSLLAAQGYASKVQLIDSRENSYLRAETPDGQGVSSGLSAILSALLGVVPPPDSNIRPEGAQELASILKPSLKKPQAHAAITVPGLPIGELAEVFPGRTSLQIQFEAHDRHAADALLSSHAQVSAANPDVHITSLDQSLLNECEGRCAHHVHTMAAAIFGAGQGSRLTLADGSTLDLEQLGGPMLSMELASLHAGITQFVQRCQRGDVHAQDVHVLVMTFLGLQDVQARHGLGSPKAVASKAAVKQALTWAVEQLDAVLRGDVTYQVAAADALPSLHQEGLGQWKEQARLMLEGTPDLSLNAGEGKPWYGDDEAAQSKRFTAKAAAYGSFILLVYAILGATVCLCDMRAKRDTMLFGTKKTD